MRFPLFILLSILTVTNAYGQGSASSEATGIRTAVMKVLDDYMEPFNGIDKLDMEIWERTMHFPHYRLASGEMKVQHGAGELTLEALKRALGQEWHHSKWQSRRIVHLSESKVHVDTSFARFRKDGSVIASYDSLYILTKESGRWGVKMRSSMAP